MIIRLKEAARACREKENDSEAHKAGLQEREPVIFSDRKKRDDVAWPEKRTAIKILIRTTWHSRHKPKG